MNNRTIVLLLSAVLIAAVVSGCMQEVSEIGTQDATPPAPVSEEVRATASWPVPRGMEGWKHIGYRNLSISNAPALNQTARITYSIIPDRDIEILWVYITIPDDGFELMDVEGTWPQTWRNTRSGVIYDTNDPRWCPTNLSKDKLYQFSATIKAVKAGNWTICSYRGIKEAIYLSVSEDSAYISDEPFPKPVLVGTSRVLTKSEFEKIRANMTTPDTTRTFVPGPSDEPPIPRQEPFSFGYWWNGTARIKIESMPKNMTSPYWNGTAWVEGINQS